VTSFGSPVGTDMQKGDLIEAVSAIQADRDRATADKTRRVVMASAGLSRSSKFQARRRRSKRRVAGRR